MLPLLLDPLALTRGAATTTLGQQEQQVGSVCGWWPLLQSYAHAGLVSNSGFTAELPQGCSWCVTAGNVTSTTAQQWWLTGFMSGASASKVCAHTSRSPSTMLHRLPHRGCSHSRRQRRH